MADDGIRFAKARLQGGAGACWVAVEDVDPGLREHELYAYHYDRVDRPAVAHGNE